MRLSSLSLTSFVDVVTKAGSTKLTAVRNLVRRPDEYDPRRDFYRPFRRAIIEAHRDGKGKKHLKGLAARQSDEKKTTNYRPAVKAYRKWWGRKSFDWFDPPRATWRSGAVGVTVNPELGLARKGERKLIKLYFKKEKLTKRRVDPILHLMEETLREDAPDATMCVHDIRRGKVFKPTVPKPGLLALLEGEAASLEATWKRLNAKEPAGV